MYRTTGLYESILRIPQIPLQPIPNDDANVIIVQSYKQSNGGIDAAGLVPAAVSPTVSDHN